LKAEKVLRQAALACCHVRQEGLVRIRRHKTALEKISGKREEKCPPAHWLFFTSRHNPQKSRGRCNFCRFQLHPLGR
jgi:hypothetical protein